MANSYASYTNQFNNMTGGSSSSWGVNSKLVNSLSASQGYKYSQGDGIPEVRTGWRKALDLLSTGDYAVMNGINAGIHHQNVLQGVAQGAMSGLDIFNDKFNKYRTTGSDVLESAGWAPTSLGGRVAKGIVGFAGDVLLDPTTYLTGGASALVKGTGEGVLKAGAVGLAKGLAEKHGFQVADDLKAVPAQVYKSVYDESMKHIGDTDFATHLASKESEKATEDLAPYLNGMTKDMATKIVTEHYATSVKDGLSVSPEHIDNEASQLVRKFNKSIGIHSKPEDLTLSLGNLPFSKWLIPKALRDPSLKLGSGEAIAKFSDANGLSNPYNKLRESVYASKLGQLFKTSTGAYKFATQSPNDFFKLMANENILSGLGVDKATRESMHLDMMRSLNNLTPAEQQGVLKAMQDKKSMTAVKEATKFMDSEKAKDYQIELGKMQKTAQEEFAGVTGSGERLQMLVDAKGKELSAHNLKLDGLRKQYTDELLNLKNTHLLSHEQQMEHINKLQDEADRLHIDAPTGTQRVKVGQVEKTRIEQVLRQKQYTHSTEPMMGGLVSHVDESKMADEFIAKNPHVVQAMRDGIDSQWNARQAFARMSHANPSADELARFAAYRKIATEMGYNIGEFKFDPKNKNWEGKMIKLPDLTGVQELHNVETKYMEDVYHDVPTTRSTAPSAEELSSKKFAESEKQRVAQSVQDEHMRNEMILHHTAWQQNIEHTAKWHNEIKPAIDKIAENKLKPARTVADLDVLRKKYGEEVVPHGVTKKDYTASRLVHNQPYDEQIHELRTNGSPRDEHDRGQLIEKMGEYLYGDKNAFDKGIYDSSVKKLHDAIFADSKEVEKITVKHADDPERLQRELDNIKPPNKSDIRAMVEGKPDDFNGKMSLVHSYVAKEMHFGAGTQYPTWKAFFTDRIKNMVDKLPFKEGNGLREAHFKNELDKAYKDNEDRFVGLVRQAMREGIISEPVGHSLDLYKTLMEKQLERNKLLVVFRDGIDMKSKHISGDGKAGAEAIIKYLETDKNIKDLFKETEEGTLEEKRARILDHQSALGDTTKVFNADGSVSHDMTKNSLKYTTVNGVVIGEDGKPLLDRFGSKIDIGGGERLVRDGEGNLTKTRVDSATDKNFKHADLEEKSTALPDDAKKAIEGDMLNFMSRTGKKVNPQTPDYIRSMTEEIQWLYDKKVFKDSYTKLNEKQRGALFAMASENRKLQRAGQPRVKPITDEAILKHKVEQQQKVLDAVTVNQKPVKQGSIVHFNTNKETTVMRDRPESTIIHDFNGRIVHVNGVGKDATYTVQKERTGTLGNDGTFMFNKDVLVPDIKHEHITVRSAGGYADSGAHGEHGVGSAVRVHQTEETMVPKEVKFNKFERNVGEITDRHIDDANHAVTYDVHHLDKEGNRTGEISSISASQITKVRDEVQLLHEDPIKYVDEVIDNSQVVAEQIKHKEDMISHINDLKKEFEQLGAKHDDEIAKMTSDYVERSNNIKTVIANFETRHAQLKQSLMENNDVSNELLNQLKQFDNALNNDDALELMYKGQYGDEAYRSAINSVTPKITGYVLNDELPLTDKAKEIVNTLRNNLIQMGKDEVQRGKLNADSFDHNMMNYLPHILTDGGEKLFKDNIVRYDVNEGKLIATPKTVSEQRGHLLTQDFGFGQVYNPHNESRTIKKILLDGKWIHNPTIEEINKGFSELMGGGRLMSEDIANIYITRAMKNSELMYDHDYMHNMMNIVGKEYIGEGLANHHTVMNFGKYKESATHLSGVNVGLDLSIAISEHVGNLLMTAFSHGHEMSQKEIELGVKQFMKTTYNKKVLQGMFDNYEKQFYKNAGYNKNDFEAVATPMLHLGQDNAKSILQHFYDTKARFDGLIGETKGKIQRQMEYMSKNPDKHEKFKEIIGHYMDKMDKLAVRRDKVKNPQIANVAHPIVERANRFRKIMMAKDANRFLQMYDRFTHLIKLNQTVVLPSFHARNLVANKFLSWLGVGSDVFNYKMTRDTWRAVAHDGNPDMVRGHFPINAKDGTAGVMHYTDAWHLAKERGVVDNSFFAKDIGAESATHGLTGSKFDPTNAKDFWAYKKGTEWGSQIENSDRFLHFVSRLKSGDSVDEAVESVNHFLFDYSDITSFEANVMKRVMPFYTFLRKNGALQLEQLLMQPKKYQTVAKVLQGVEGMTNSHDRLNRGLVNDFAKDWLQTPWSITNKLGNREPIMINPSLPFQDLSRIPDPMHPIDSVLRMISMSNPMIKVPLELKLNHDFFFKQPIFPPQGKTETTGQSTTKNIGLALDHIASQSSLYVASKGLWNKTGMDWGLEMMNDTIGVKAISYDYEKWKTQNAANYYASQKDWSHQLINGAVSSATSLIQSSKNTIGSMASGLEKGRPMSAGMYNNALAPISAVSYSKLSVAEQAKYAPPSEKTAYAYNLQAKIIEKQQYAQTGVMKKFVWTLLDMAGMSQHDAFTVGSVTHVQDGDTLDVMVNGKKTTVRMLLIDTPETVHPKMTKLIGGDSGEQMPFGHVASEHTKTYMIGKDVRLVFDKNASQSDAHNRGLAYVEIPSEGGLDYNKSLIDNGMAKLRYNYNNYSRADAYTQAEQAPMQKKQGIWSLDGYARPDDTSFRTNDDILAKYRDYLKQKK